jgi:PAS domain S-box-containing protein
MADPISAEPSTPPRTPTRLARVLNTVQVLAVVGVCTAIAALVYLHVLTPVFGRPVPVVLIVVAVMASAAYGGLRAGLFATALGVAFVAWTIDWAAPDRATDAARLLLLAVGSVIAAAVAAALLRARRRAEAAYATLAEASAARRVVEERLAASEARLRELVEAFPEIMFVADGSGRARYANPRWAEYVGTAADTAHWAERVHPEDRERVTAAWTLAVNTEAPFELRCRLADAAGASRWFLVRARPMRAASGDAVQWFGVATDVDAQMRAEAALRDREEQLRLALESTGLGVFEFEFWTRRIVWSERCRTICGFARDEAITARRIVETIHPDDRRRALRALARARAARGGGEFALELRLVTAAGHVRWVAARGCVFFVATADGERPLRCVGTLLDYSERQRVETRLRSSEERFRLAVEAVDGIIYDWDVATGEVLRTRGLSELLGYDPAEVPADPDWWSSIMHPDDYARVAMDHAAREAAGATRSVAEYRVRHRQGHWVTLLDRAYIARDASGRATRVVGCSQDITELRRVEAELRAADRRKDEFLAVLAHELRNPLAPMRAAVQLLGGPQEAQRTAWARAVLERQLAQMVRLIDDLLDVARITAGKLALQWSRVRLQSLVDGAVETAAPLLRERGHALAVDVRNGDAEIDCDAARVSQVLANLLNNAAKYTPAGGHLAIEARLEDGNALFRVADDGVGIAPGALGRLFDLFAQGGQAPGAGASGLGVGLPLARALIAMHDGQIDVASPGPGRGTTVTVRLPLRTLLPHESPAAAPHVPSERRRVLVVDDNRDAADTLTELLRAHGHDATPCYDGAQALAAADALRPEVVLLDIGMPRLDGHEVARRLRAQPWGRALRIVALSGFGQAEDRRRSLEAGCDEHLIKPVADADLQRALGAAASASAAPATARAR